MPSVLFRIGAKSIHALIYFTAIYLTLCNSASLSLRSLICDTGIIRADVKVVVKKATEIIGISPLPRAAATNGCGERGHVVHDLTSLAWLLYILF